MHDFILTAIEREIGSDERREYSPIPRPATVSFSTDRSEVFCAGCGEIVKTVNALEAADSFNTDLQDIRFLLNSGEIHKLREDPKGIAICRRSLDAIFETRRTRLLDSHFELEMKRLIGAETE
jgi:hypothetical protein